MGPTYIPGAAPGAVVDARVPLFDAEVLQEGVLGLVDQEAGHFPAAFEESVGRRNGQESAALCCQDDSCCRLARRSCCSCRSNSVVAWSAGSQTSQQHTRHNFLAQTFFEADFCRFCCFVPHSATSRLEQRDGNVAGFKKVTILSLTSSRRTRNSFSVIDCFYPNSVRNLVPEELDLVPD